MSGKIFFTLDEAFLYYTECHLATLEMEKGYKRSSKRKITRLEEISDDMVQVVKDHVKPMFQERLRGYPRVKKRLFPKETT